MRILHLSNHIRKTGNGIVNVAVDLACIQARLGHTVAIASSGGDFRPLLETNGVSTYHLPTARSAMELWQSSREFQRLLKKFQPDIIHAHMITGLMLAWGLRWGQSYRLVSTVHNEFQRSAILMGLADRVVAVSQSVAHSMQQRGVPEEKLRVVLNGTLGSPRTRRLSDYSPQLLKHPAITTVAGMYRRKGIAELIDAFARVALDFPEAHLYLVGDGPDRSDFEVLAKATGFGDRIHFEGFQPEPTPYLLATDIFVLYSRREPFGLVIPEAREAGCAIIASQVDGIPEALSGGQAGQLIAPGRPEDLAGALAQLLGDQTLLHYWQKQSQTDLQDLTAERVCQETLDVYTELLPMSPNALAKVTQL
jgi:glycosyltransferase involved in cell wall biosynthesis